MQTLADVLNMPIRVIRSEQACALGAAMFAAVSAGIYPSIELAMKYMGSEVEKEYIPKTKHTKIYDILYSKYLQLALTAEKLK